MKKSNLFVNLSLWIFTLLTFIFITVKFVSAQTVSDSDSVDVLRKIFSIFSSSSTGTSNIPITSPTPIGTTNSTNETQLIENLVAQITVNCPNAIVTNQNESCLSKIIINGNPLAQSLISQLKPSTNACSDPLCYLQCVRMVKASVLLTNGIFDTYGNAIEYKLQNKWPTGYHFAPKGSVSIKVGDLPIWNVGANGHIAYVTQVVGSNYFEVAEANFDKPGHVRLYLKSLDDPTLAGWLTKD